VSLQPGDGLVVHTRGLVEATDAGGGAYGEQRLKVALDVLIAAPAATITSTLREDAAGFSGGVPFKDDVTIVALRLDA
jgi:serine phosphatase RsbU (regulator of sigma subunit)